MKQFNRLVIDIESIEGGTIITAQMHDGSESVDQKRQIVTGKVGGSLNTRVRRALKLIADGAYPRTPKVMASADLPGQQKFA